jgi:hypothetical protein
MQKMLITILAIAGITIFGLAGCSRSETGGGGGPGGGGGGASIDTSKIQSAFQNAPSADKTEVQHAVSAIKSGDYTTGLASLQKVASSTNLTPEQKSAVSDLMNQVKAKAGGAAGKTMGGVSNAVGGATK